MAIILPKQIGTEEGKLLFQKSEAVESFDEGKEIVKSLKESLDYYGGVGLAAPQVGIAQRIFIVDIKPSEFRPEIAKIGFRAYINPLITVVSSKTNESAEGCLSVIYGSLFGKVERASFLKIEYFDVEGKKHIEEIKDSFHARVVQHEFDHLNGKVFLQRMKPENFATLLWEEGKDIRNKN